VKVGAEKVGNRVRVKVTKNKVAPPFREAEVEIIFGRGIDRMGDLINIASDLEIVQKSGSWFAYNETRLGQGKEKAAAFLAAEPALEQEIRERVSQALMVAPRAKGLGRAENEVVSASDEGDAILEA
jgi:recombination protein RecA